MREEIRVNNKDEMMEIWASYVIEWKCTDADAWINDIMAFATNGIDYVYIVVTDLQKIISLTNVNNLL